MKTKLFIPNNFFTRLFVSELSETDNLEIVKTSSALISKSLAADSSSLGLLPSLDLVTNKDFFVSSRIGISFNSLLSNSYLYFKEDQESLDRISVLGDVSTNELIISKILFREFYDIEPELVLSRDLKNTNEENILLVGDNNYSDSLFFNGLSYTEEVLELLNAPYVNFVLAGLDENLLKTFVNKNEPGFLSGHEKALLNAENNFSESSLNFLSENIQNLIFDFEDQDLEGIKTLLQMPYYYGIIKEIFELKFV